MLKIEALVQPFRLEAVTAALDRLGIEGVTICRVSDHAGPLGQMAHYRGAEYSVDAPRVKLEMLVSSLQADEVIDAVARAARSGLAGDDGIIMVSEVTEAIRIRNGEKLQFAAHFES